MNKYEKIHEVLCMIRHAEYISDTENCSFEEAYALVKKMNKENKRKGLRKTKKV